MENQRRGAKNLAGAPRAVAEASGFGFVIVGGILGIARQDAFAHDGNVHSIAVAGMPRRRAAAAENLVVGMRANDQNGFRHPHPQNKQLPAALYSGRKVEEIATSDNTTV